MYCADQPTPGECCPEQSADPLPSPALPGHPLLLRPAVLDEQQVDLQVTKGPVIGVTEAL